jgi:hypothetical protein
MSFLKKRNLQRFRIFVRRYFRRFSKNFESSEVNKLDEIQKRALYTVRRMISKPDAVLLIAPISGISYIEWKHYFIRFSDTALTITNGKYSYYIWMPSSQLDKLKDIMGGGGGSFVLRGSDLVLALNRSETSLNLRRGA